MLRILSLFSLIVLVPQHLTAQIMPRECSVLNYRIIGFSIPPEQKVINYTLEIAAGNYNSEDSFKKKIINTLHNKTNKIIAEVPFFGSAYTWRVVYTFSKSSKTITSLFHFSTGTIPEVDTTITRLRITKPALKYNDAYVFLDGNKALYDMTGHPVWYLPKTEGKSLSPIDLKLSSQGTITFISDNAYEINYDGDILWKAPNDGKANGKNRESYHHEFTRLNNGHYMVFTNEFLSCKKQPDNSFYISLDKSDSTCPKSLFGILVEYDEQGNIVWEWKSSAYFETSDLINYKPMEPRRIIDLHDNAFYYDEKNKNIYISFKNISRILKIKYPEGTVVNTYGEIFKPGVPETGNGLFCGQHACNLSDSGYIYFYDNNTCDSGALPKIVMMEDSGAQNGGLTIVWEYDCTIKGKKTEEMKNDFISGGNVTELSDHSIFACMSSSSYCKLFIVNKDKKKLWSARPERWDEAAKKWHPASQYRASIIQSRKDLERLIWNAEIKDQPAIAHTNLNVAGTHSELPIKPISGTQ